ncbi:NUDIX domain-containing protein [Actinomycetospora endophytica]|uniref:NUDIX domain-containing protein n=1 Tax=Actinomycetospora endophytica TaxID=2291215 RepID=A0ABS8P7J0_9PSEU|nr:NUDIX domain-containing protein [Actinomycetospora endophytica]MCD2194089.1 NUDIX domain-containing protein [Actinomycetospora endophytica]
MADTPKHSVSVAGIVVDAQDRVLVIQRRDNGHWEPPGGVLELLETPEAGVRREVLEETGALIAVERLTGIYKNLSAGVVALVFRCRIEGGPVGATEESASVRWLTLDRAEKLMAPAYSVRIRDAFGSQVAVRSHDGEQIVGSL